MIDTAMTKRAMRVRNRLGVVTRAYSLFHEEDDFGADLINCAP